MFLKKIFLLVLGFGLLTNAFSQQNFKSIFVKGFSDNSLEVLDWGGKGNPIIFLAGLGNTPHIFDDFAPKFTNRFHVFGMTRRGFGKSDRTTAGFSTDTLVQDILKVMDNLSLKKVILIGHSISGDEISAFARQYPERVLATIFLDAALNHAVDFNKLLGPFPQTPKPTEAFVPTLKNVQADYFAGHGFYFPLGELNALGKFDKNGLYLDDTTAYSAYDKIINAGKPISYKGMKCRSLAIYVKAPTVAERFRTYALFDSTNKKIAEKSFPKWNKYYQTEMARYKTECYNCVVKEIRGAQHYIFLSNSKETEILIRNFLKGL